MIRLRACAAIALLVALPGAARAELQLRTEPSPLVLGGSATVRLVLRGELPADPVRADVNVGSVRRIERDGERLVVHYALPEGRHPRRLCLLIWQDAPQGRAQAIRVPLLGRSEIPVRTRRDSTVVVRVGDRSFGPLSSGPRGRVRVPVLVAPGVTGAVVEVTDRAGLTSSKTVRIRQPRYAQLAAAAIPQRTSDERVSVRVVVAAADPELADVRVSAGDAPQPVRAQGTGQWEAQWAPEERPPAGAVALHVRAAPPHDGERTLTVEVLPAASAAAPAPRAAQERPVAAARRRTPPAPRRWHAVVGAGAGVAANLGDLLAPRLTVEAGVERTLSWGILGLRLLVGVSWASQRIDAPAPLARADAAVLLLPLSAGLAYRYPLRLVEPQLTAAFVAQVVRTRSAGPGIAERVIHDLAPGFLVAAGAGRRLGPGHVYLQAGYLYGRLDGPEIALLAGGLIVDAGYRLSL